MRGTNGRGETEDDSLVVADDRPLTGSRAAISSRTITRAATKTREDSLNDNCGSDGYYDHRRVRRVFYCLLRETHPLTEPGPLSFHLEIAPTSSLFRIFMRDRPSCEISSFLREQLLPALGKRR